jgi:hypothetical protein
VDNSGGGCCGLFTVEGMRTAAAATALGLVLVTAGLTSCATPKVGLQPPEPDPSATPVFASDEEALAAAEELYGRYLRIANKIGQGGWKDTSGYAEVTRDQALADELASAEDYSSKGYRQVGDFRSDSMTVQQLRDPGSTEVNMTVYVCLDVSNVDVKDKSGRSVVAPERLDRQPLELTIDNSEGALKVSRSDAWSGADFC